MLYHQPRQHYHHHHPRLDHHHHHPPTHPAAHSHSRIPVPPLEKFSGSGSVTEWWTTFLIYVSIHGLSESSAIQKLPFYLTAVAHQWFMHLSPTCKTSLKTVEEAIYQRFKPRAPLKREVLKIQQFPEETVEQYPFRVRKLAADSAMEDSLITFFAMEGPRQELRTIVFPPGSTEY